MCVCVCSVQFQKVSHSLLGDVHTREVEREREGVDLARGGGDREMTAVADDIGALLSTEDTPILHTPILHTPILHTGTATTPPHHKVSRLYVVIVPTCPLALIYMHKVSRTHISLYILVGIFRNFIGYTYTLERSQLMDSHGMLCSADWLKSWL